MHKLPVISNFQQNPTVTVLMIMPGDLSVSILLESQIPYFENSTLVSVSRSAVDASVGVALDVGAAVVRSKF